MLEIIQYISEFVLYGDNHATLRLSTTGCYLDVPSYMLTATR